MVTMISNTTFTPNTKTFKNLDYMYPSIVSFLDVFANCFVINIISLFGIVGNSINIAVLRQHGTRESTNIILISLSISDLLFSTLLPITRLKCVVGHLCDPALTMSLNAFVTVYFFMPKFVCLGTSFFYVSLIAVERFVAVFFPFRVSKIFTRRTVFILSLSIFFFSLVAISPSFSTFKLAWVFDEEFKATVAVVELTEFYQTNHVILDYYVWIGLNNLFCAISVSIVFACCVAICVKLNRAARKRELMTSGTAAYDVRVVKMLVTVCCIYLCVIMPTITMYMFFKPSFIFESPVHKIMNDVCDILCAVNASANFVVYVTMSRKFSRTYKRLLGCQGQKNGDQKVLKLDSVAVNLVNKIMLLRKWLS